MTAGTALGAAALLGLLGALVLVVRSLHAFSYSGPAIREEVRRSYRSYSFFAVLRLAAWSSAVIAWMALIGSLPYIALQLHAGQEAARLGLLASGIAGVVIITALQFSHHLLHIPCSIMMSSNYKMSRFYFLWSRLTVSRIRWARALLCAAITLPVARGLGAAAAAGEWRALLELSGMSLLAAAPLLYAVWPGRAAARRAPARPGAPPNILMIGCDTLRVDRLGVSGYRRNLTPFLDALANRGSIFLNCYSPLARTAPSLASLLTGVWPQTHGIRTNFTSDEEARLPVPSLPRMLRERGYATCAIGDWAGSDLGKLSFGFEHTDLPLDQWNLKYLIRQGPKDIRLFLSLFSHNRFGKAFLPEIYFLAGVPLTAHLGREARAAISRYAGAGRPFFMNVFMATAHPPFGCEYPHYTLYSKPEYAGESKFAMARLVDPFDIIRSQREPREAFELDQVIDLYDACVRRFDDEVRSIVHHVRACGLEDNTVLVLYSDHGMELFEHDTWGQGNSAVGEASPRVPLIIVDPRRRGCGVDGRVVRTVDLVPTLLERCGLEIPAAVEGVSLLSYLDDKARDFGLPAYFETGIWLTPPPGRHERHVTYPEIFELLEVPDKRTGTLAIKRQYREIVVQARDRMIRAGRWKLVRFPLLDGPLYQLFDVERDPHCRVDVARQHPEVVGELRRRLDRWSARDA